jgi:hypothetical protein
MVAVMFSVIVATASHLTAAAGRQVLLLLLLLLQLLLLLFIAAAAARLFLSLEFLTVLVLRMRSRVDCDLSNSILLK